MALDAAINIPTSDTLKINYWRIGGYYVQPGGFVHVDLEGYWSEQDRRSEKVPADERRITIQNPPEDFGREWLYEQVKLLPEFSGAGDALGAYDPVESIALAVDARAAVPIAEVLANIAPASSQELLDAYQLVGGSRETARQLLDRAMRSGTIVYSEDRRLVPAVNASEPAES